MNAAAKLIALALTLHAVDVAGQGVVGGTLRGRVLEETTGTPIRGAAVDVMDGRTRIRGTTMSDPEGNFALTNVPPGSFRLRVTRIGYKDTTTPYWRVQNGEVLQIVVRLDASAVPIAPLEIAARANAPSPVLDGFHHRTKRGVGGTFITRADIEKSNATLVSDLLNVVPGLRMESAPGAGRNGKIPTFEARIAPGGGLCAVQIFVDGVLANRQVGATTPPLSVDEIATPGGLEGIEVYRGLSTLPPELITNNARCGVIALWTRR